MAASELSRRLAVAAVGIPAVVVAVWLGGWVLAGLLAAAAAGAAWELYRMAAGLGTRAFVVPGCLLAAGFPLTAAAVPDPSVAAGRFWLLLLLATLLLSAAAIWRRGVSGRPLASVGVTLLAALLTGGTLAYGVFLRTMDAAGGVRPADALSGSLLVGFPLILTWVSDSGAYFGGRALGRRKLIPAVSPGKTVEGAVSGVLSTVAAGVFYAWLLQLAGIPLALWAGGLGGALMSVVAQVGDLSESLLKREAGVKDSGTFFPGHGGLFDRVDSLLFTVPVAYWYLSLIL
jgi:phosphatidate cytidylyltransferase